MARILWGTRIKTIHLLVPLLVSALALPGSSAARAKKCDLKAGVSVQQARAGLCRFDPEKKAFAGTAAEQAACLTREVKRKARIGKETITPYLKELAGQPGPSVQSVQSLLDAKDLKPEALGGPLARGIKADYFIIHDTSWPNCSNPGPPKGCPTRGAFPPDRDEAGWIVNKNFGGRPKQAPNRIANVFVNRVGASVTEVDFALPFATTKFETCVDAEAKKELFVGIENIQPRIGDPRIPAEGKRANDYDAPDPGFTPGQYERLALLYVVASARRGQWLIPAFHAVIDSAYADGHDDPQRFDMPAFSAAVQRHAAALVPGAPVAAAGLAQPQAREAPAKFPLPAFKPAACERIAARASSLEAQRTSETTQYFTPIFRPGPNGGLRDEDRYNCLSMEGSCIVGNFLYNTDGSREGRRYHRQDVAFMFGKGSGASQFNRTNALIPCRTLAADRSIYPVGTVVYISAFVGKICPQNEQPVDGCFIVGDVGAAIKGQGRFDIFTGECSRYDARTHSCLDPRNPGFNVPRNTAFRIVPRESQLATDLRTEVDAFIENGWKPAAR